MSAQPDIPSASAELVDAWVANMAAGNLTVATQQLRRGAVTAYARSTAPSTLAKGTTATLAAWLEGYDDRGLPRGSRRARVESWGRGAPTGRRTNGDEP